MFYIVGISQLLHIVSLVDVKGHEKGESEHPVVTDFSSVKTLFPGSEGKCYRIYYKSILYSMYVKLGPLCYTGFYI